jgi:hypothetical protein
MVGADDPGTASVRGVIEAGQLGGEEERLGGERVDRRRQSDRRRRGRDERGTGPRVDAVFFVGLGNERIPERDECEPGAFGGCHRFLQCPRRFVAAVQFDSQK